MRDNAYDDRSPMDRIESGFRPESNEPFDPCGSFKQGPAHVKPNNAITVHNLLQLIITLKFIFFIFFIFLFTSLILLILFLA